MMPTLVISRSDSHHPTLSHEECTAIGIYARAIISSTDEAEKLYGSNFSHISVGNGRILVGGGISERCVGIRVTSKEPQPISIHFKDGTWRKIGEISVYDEYRNVPKTSEEVSQELRSLINADIKNR
jgi:hypothetical protein